MKRYHEHILDRIQKMKPFYSEENYFWSRGIHFTVMNNYLNEMIDYLFNLDVQVNKCFKRFVIVFLFLPFLERCFGLTFRHFIIYITCTLFGYYFGYRFGQRFRICN